MLLLVGGGGGFVGRHLLPALAARYRVRSLHRHPDPAEAVLGVEWVRADVESYRRWEEILGGVSVVVNLAWYRSGGDRRFRRMYEGLARCLDVARGAKVARFLQLSVPPAPPGLERRLPYLRWKRRFDESLLESGLSVRVLRPTMLFGEGDVLLGAMGRVARRYGRLPMFGDGAYRISPLWAGDLARIATAELEGPDAGTLDLGGPRTYRYRELTDLVFRAVGRPARYWRMTEANGARLAGLLEALGSHLLYRYEVEWLVSDLLALPPYGALGGPRTVEEQLGLAEASPERSGGSEGPPPPAHKQV